MVLTDSIDLSAEEIRRAWRQELLCHSACPCSAQFLFLPLCVSPFLFLFVHPGLKASIIQYPITEHGICMHVDMTVAHLLNLCASPEAGICLLKYEHTSKDMSHTHWKYESQTLMQMCLQSLCVWSVFIRMLSSTQSTWSETTKGLASACGEAENTIWTCTCWG